MFNKLSITNEGYFITNKRPFNPILNLNEYLNSCFDFAYNMSFGNEGEHRNHRTGGQHYRKNGELFINTFQGKLCEFGVWCFFDKNGFKSSEPDLDNWELGKWDDTDLIINNKKINIKSTAFIGNLLLLEIKDWNEQGAYIPNIEKGTAIYDYFILTRLKPDGKKIMREHRWMFLNTINKDELKNEILNQVWEFDIAGWISLSDLKDEIITKKFILPQNELLNGTIKMDATNYYIQAGDLKEINSIFSVL